MHWFNCDCLHIDLKLVNNSTHFQYLGNRSLCDRNRYLQQLCLLIILGFSFGTQLASHCKNFATHFCVRTHSLGCVDMWYLLQWVQEVFFLSAEIQEGQDTFMNEKHWWFLYLGCSSFERFTWRCYNDTDQ